MSKKRLAKEERRNAAMAVTLKPFKPKTINQNRLFQAIQNPDKKIILVSGPAGTGKTCCAAYLGLKGIINGDFEKLYLTRPAIEACGEEFGFLKGGIDSKIYPYLIPLYEEFEKFSDIQVVLKLKANRKIDIAPLAFMRGRNFEKCFVILDEAQNASYEQFKMILTRMHEDSKLIICGDFEQSDRKNRQDFQDICYRLNGMDVVEYISFDDDDILRSGFIREILNRLHRERD